MHLAAEGANIPVIIIANYSTAFRQYVAAEGTALLHALQLLWKKALPRAKILASARLCKGESG